MTDAEQKPANALLSFISACQKALFHTSSVPLNTLCVPHPSRTRQEPPEECGSSPDSAGFEVQMSHIDSQDLDPRGLDPSSSPAQCLDA